MNYVRKIIILLLFLSIFLFCFLLRARVHTYNLQEEGFSFSNFSKIKKPAFFTVLRVESSYNRALLSIQFFDSLKKKVGETKTVYIDNKTKVPSPMCKRASYPAKEFVERLKNTIEDKNDYVRYFSVSHLDIVNNHVLSIDNELCII